MTVQTRFFDWQKSGLPSGSAPWQTCSPNLRALLTYLTGRWKGRSVGCHVERAIKATTAPSSHAYGAALDWRYGDDIGRDVLLAEVVPWLIGYSAELGIDAIHDYVGNRIWRPPGTSGRPADGDGWKTYTGSDSSMGNPSSTWLHIETHRDAWADGSPIDERITMRRTDLLDISSHQTITKYADLPDVPIVHRAVTNEGTLDSRFVSRAPHLAKRHELFGGYVVLAPGIIGRQMSAYVEAMRPHWRDGVFTQLDVEPWDGIGLITVQELIDAVMLHERAFGAGRVCVYMNPLVVPKLWDAFVSVFPDMPRWVPGYRDDDDVKARKYGATIHQWTDEARPPGFTGNTVDANEVLDWTTVRQFAGLEQTGGDDVTPRYFRTPGSPTALWVTTDGVTATRVVPSQHEALGAPGGELLTVAEARRFAFVNALNHDVVGL